MLICIPRFQRESVPYGGRCMVERARKLWKCWKPFEKMGEIPRNTSTWRKAAIVVSDFSALGTEFIKTLTHVPRSLKKQPMMFWVNWALKTQYSILPNNWKKLRWKMSILL